MAFLWDYRWLIILMISLFIIIPFVTFILLINYGLEPLTTYNILPHVLKLDDNQLIIEFTDQDCQRPIKPIILRYDWLNKIKYKSEALILFFNQYQKGFIIIPFYSINYNLDIILHALLPYIKKNEN